MEQPVAQQNPPTPPPPPGTPGADGSPGDPLDPTTSLLQGIGSEPAPSRTGRTVAVLGIGLVVLAGLYAGAQWFVGDKVPHGTTVAGVDIGGLDVQAAEQRLASGLADPATEPIAVIAGGKKAQLDPAKAGLRVDVDGTVEPLVTFGLAPARLWHAVFGGDEVTPRVDVDDAKLDAQLATVAKKVAVSPTDGDVRFVDASAVSTAPHDGAALDTSAARRAVVDGWLRTDGPITLPVRTVHPTVGSDAVQAALVTAGTLTSASVQVKVGSHTVTIPSDVLAGTAGFTADDGKLDLTLDPAELRTAVLARAKGLVTKPQDAAFVFTKGKPVVKGGKNGTDLDPAKLAAAVTSVATQRSGRTATVALSVKQPAVTADHLRSLGVTKQVSVFSTPLTSEKIRTENLRVGAEKVTGDLLEPGDTFSLLDALAPITVAGGFQEAHVISNGQLIEGVGGGLSQLSTTTYNAAFFAGLDIVTHKPHSFYIPRYPVGRESTLAVPSVDMKFTNDTPYGVLVRAWIKDDRYYVALWSTPYYKVTTTTSDRSNVVPRSTIHSSSPSCIADPGGQPGFSVSVRRVVSTLDGKQVKDETNHWTYNPENTVICTKDK